MNWTNWFKSAKWFGISTTNAHAYTHTHSHKNVHTLFMGLSVRSLCGRPDWRSKSNGPSTEGKTEVVSNFSPLLFQGPAHPNPGKPYTARGFPRHCYLPDSEKGRKVLGCGYGCGHGCVHAYVYLCLRVRACVHVFRLLHLFHIFPQLYSKIVFYLFVSHQSTQWQMWYFSCWFFNTFAKMY